MLHQISSFLVIFLAVSSIASASDTDRITTAEMQAIQNYLECRFDEFENLEAGGRSVYGLAYRPDANFTVVSCKELEVMLPETRFFQTSLENTSWCYLEVDIVVSVTRRGKQLDVRSCVSPAFDKPSPKFLALFKGISAVSDADRIRLLNCVGKLFATITPNGQLKNNTLKKNTASVELWEDGHFWREIVVEFNKRNTVDSITFAIRNKQ